MKKHQWHKPPPCGGDIFFSGVCPKQVRIETSPVEYDSFASLKIISTHPIVKPSGTPACYKDITPARDDMNYVLADEGRSHLGALEALK